MTSRFTTRTRRALSRLARPRRARVLPQLEHQAAAPDGARAVRLRERGLHQGAVDRARASPTTTPASSSKRAGLSTRDEYLEELSDQIEAVQTTPGRLVTSVDMASFDTWIKQYRPDENTPNTTDQLLPERRGDRVSARRAAFAAPPTDAKSLDDAMRLAYQRYSGAEGLHARAVLPDDERRGGDRSARVVCDSRRNAPRSWTTREALDWFGLRFRAGRHAQPARLARRDDAQAMAAGWWCRRCAATRLPSPPA